MILKKYLLFFFFTFISIPLFAAQSIVILPFTDESKTQQAYWLGEGFAESLTEEMLLKNAYVIRRLERKAAYDAFRLPYVGHVSRATMLKLGNHLGVDYIVFGSYTVEGQNLKVEARVIQTSSSKLSAPVSAHGVLDNLYDVQAALTKSLKDFFVTRKLEPSEVKQARSSVPLHAYELYIKGLLEASDQGKVQFFQRAVSAHSDYPQANYRLGFALHRLGRFKESTDALNRIQGDGILRKRIDFLTALNSYYLGDLTGSAQKWYRLSQSNPTGEIYNNIGIALIGTNEIDNAILYLIKAVGLDAENPDFRFNLGAAYVQKGMFREAASFFREAVIWNPQDYQSLYWLSKSMERAGDNQAKRLNEIFLERLPGDQKGKFPEQYPAITQLLRLSSFYLAKEERDYVVASRMKQAKQRADYLKTYQASARRHLDENHPDRAILDLKKGMTFAPLDWYIHHLWGLAVIEQGNRGGAVPHLQFSLWCTENIDSHILLAEMYRDSEQYAASKKHIQHILALDPKHKKAIEIWSKIHNKN
jgi:tetratricopeptide (TPR) repeat protein